MAEATTQITSSTELFEADPIGAEANDAYGPNSTAAEGEPAETPLATDALPVVDTPPVVEPPVDILPVDPATPPVEPPPVATAPEPERQPGDKRPSWSEMRQLRKELDEKNALLARFQQPIYAPPIQQALPVQAPPTEVKPVPDPNEDPVGFMQWQNEQIIVQQNALANQNAQLQQRQAAQELQSLISTQISDFSARQSDYRAAAEYLEQREIGRWKAMGYTDQEAIQRTQERALQVVAGALQLGRSIPETLYEIALSEANGVPAWAQPAGGAAATGALSTDAAPNGNGNGAAVLTPAQKVTQSQAKTAATRSSMGSVAGAPTPGKVLSKEQILSMSEDELEKVFGRDDWQNITLQD